MQNPRYWHLLADCVAHEGPVVLSDSYELLFTSFLFRRPNDSHYVIVSILDLARGTTRNLGLTEAFPMVNGSVFQWECGDRHEWRHIQPCWPS
jgi:hypothetical protein